MIDDSQKNKIADISARNGAVLGYVFGSRAHGKEQPQSDIDIALFFDVGVPPREYAQREELIAEGIADALHASRVDVVNLRTSRNPVLKHRAVCEGMPIFVKDKKLQFVLEKRILEEYEDTRHLRAIAHSAMRKKIADGTLGKAPLSPSEEKIFKAYVNR